MDGEPEIRRYCMECGSDVEPGAEFCYACGSRRVIDVDSGSNRLIMEKGHCPYCGHDNSNDSMFCGACGKRIGVFEYVGRRKAGLTINDIFVLILALIPGFFNIFGLGHLAIRRYSRGAMYLVISAVYIYTAIAMRDSGMSTIIILELIGILIYVKQASEVLTEVFGYRG